MRIQHDFYPKSYSMYTIVWFFFNVKWALIIQMWIYDEKHKHNIQKFDLKYISTIILCSGNLFLS